MLVTVVQRISLRERFLEVIHDDGSRGRVVDSGDDIERLLLPVRILRDCDDDTVLVKVTRLGDGNVCHTGERSCFYRELEEKPW